MSTIHAIYENGVFRPTEPVELPEHCEVEFEPRLKNGAVHIHGDSRVASANPIMAKVYSVLGRRHEGGLHDGAERHNEHQP